MALCRAIRSTSTRRGAPPAALGGSRLGPSCRRKRRWQPVPERRGAGAAATILAQPLGRAGAAAGRRGLHLLAAYPTLTLSMIGPEKYNARRNNDEIAFWSLYLGGTPFAADDRGRSAVTGRRSWCSAISKCRSGDRPAGRVGRLLADPRFAGSGRRPTARFRGKKGRATPARLCAAMTRTWRRGERRTLARGGRAAGRRRRRPVRRTGSGSIPDPPPDRMPLQGAKAKRTERQNASCPQYGPIRAARTPAPATAPGPRGKGGVMVTEVLQGHRPVRRPPRYPRGSRRIWVLAAAPLRRAWGRDQRRDHGELQRHHRAIAAE